LPIIGVFTYLVARPSEVVDSSLYGQDMYGQEEGPRR
jgi:hypothetical protein